MFYIVIFACNLGNKQDRKKYGLKVIWVCVKLTRDGLMTTNLGCQLYTNEESPRRRKSQAKKVSD